MSSSDRRTRARRTTLGAILALASLVSLGAVAIACSPTAILPIDYEGPAIDLDACAANRAPCVRSGDVRDATVMIPGGGHEIELQAGGSIEAPLNMPGAPGRLAYLALGLYTGESSSLQIEIVGDDSTKTVLSPPPGLKRVEVDMREIVPASGARLRLTCLSGQFDFTYVVGRWIKP